LTLHWNHDRLWFGTVTFASPGAPPFGWGLEGLLRILAGIPPEEVEGDRDLRWNVPVRGDFVVREGAAAEKVVPRLEEILNQELNVPVKLTLGEVDRTVYVLSGKYKFTPARGGAENHIELYSKELYKDLSPIPPGADRPLPLGADWGGGDLAQFAQALGRFVDRRVVLGKVEGQPAQVGWHENQTGEAPQLWEAEHALEPVLKHVTEQAGLTVTKETRRVRALVVERKK
jgi:hypothetical protein